MEKKTTDVNEESAIVLDDETKKEAVVVEEKTAKSKKKTASKKKSSGNGEKPKAKNEKNIQSETNADAGAPENTDEKNIEDNAENREPAGRFNTDFFLEFKEGKTPDMSVAQFIRETNKYNYSTPAIITESRTYTHAQMFRKWEEYAEVFTALGITGDNNAKAGILFADSFETITAFFALNSVGTAVSFMTVLELLNTELWINTMAREKITDVFLMDYLVTPLLLERLNENRKRIGLRHIIILKNSLNTEAVSPVELAMFNWNYAAVHSVPGVLFMEDLLVTYETTPVTYQQDAGNKLAAIVHTSGTTKGIRKPIPMTNNQLISAATRTILTVEDMDQFAEPLVYGLAMDLSSAYALISQLLLPLISGDTVVVNYLGATNADYHRIIEKYKISSLETTAMAMEEWMQLPNCPDFSSVRICFVGGTFVSGEAKKRFNDFLAECGSKAKVCVGYGLSEAGSAVTVSDPEVEDDSVGYPLPGVKIKIQDEETGKFYDLSDGPRVGGLYVNSNSVSSGTLEGERYFDTTLIDGEEYLCTYDLVKVNENGSITCCGRTNQFFINNDGVKFNSGLVETSMEKEPGIQACIVCPAYDKAIHDTVPVLFVQTTDRTNAVETVYRALRDVFVTQNLFEKTNLPVQFVLVDSMPHNQNGKIDRYKLNVNTNKGRRYTIRPVKRGETLVDIEISETSGGSMFESVTPKELEGTNPADFDLRSMMASPDFPEKLAPLVFSGILFGHAIPKSMLSQIEMPRMPWMEKPQAPWMQGPQMSSMPWESCCPPGFRANSYWEHWNPKTQSNEDTPYQEPWISNHSCRETRYQAPWHGNSRFSEHPYREPRTAEAPSRQPQPPMWPFGWFWDSVHRR